MRKYFSLTLCLYGICLLNACGGGSDPTVPNPTTPPVALVITSPAPPAGTLQTAYGGSSSGFSLTASGGEAPYTWSWAAAAGSMLPAGLAISTNANSTGAIAGTPTASGSYSVVIKVTDSQSPAAQMAANYTITVSAAAPLRITSGTPPNGSVGAPYGPRLICRGIPCGNGFLLAATGGVQSHVWSWAAAPQSTLPPGLDVSNSNSFQKGIIAGTPTTLGTYKVVVTVTDTGSPATQASANYTISISPPPPPVINTTPAPSAGAVNLPYSFTFTATNGLAPLIWSETGALPPGLVLSTAGVLSGTPTEIGSFPITVRVQDSVGQNATPQNFTIQVFSHGFKATGSMASGRVSHTATLLSSGKVLVAGGFTDAGGLATAELFDPASGTFTPTGSMETGRFQQTATLLTNGKVLVAGGGNATAELFDAASGSFAPTGNMEASRSFQTATLLNNGKILVAGGSDAEGNPLATAELFDPASGTFTPTGSMIGARYGHTATLLNDGNVLVTGGTGASGTLATAELFDPAIGTFAATASMEIPRYTHTATLLSNGSVLVTGGFDVNSHALATAELFDPTTGIFNSIGNMSVARVFHTATLLNNSTVLVTGGSGTSTLAAAELFDPSTRTFTPTGSMTIARSAHTATLLNNGTVLVTGGANASGNAVATAEVYQ
jgi:hypothetical protein